ncbi:Molybdenum cofactor cytidylyltransferase [bioreactor metagenome]|uniref:Molybdenum cofactor cytidylyltransferase n=1 Tax=bioreactor metagenome TaxID=1076179 RepID=A0A645EST1_9ZZZZ
MREDEFFFTPGDYPLISKDVYSKILSKTGDIIIPTYKGRKGHPILIKSKFIKEILQEGKYETLRDFINIQNPKFIEVNHKEILMDIDTIEDYKKALKNLGED